jgi:hypothetical protein
VTWIRSSKSPKLRRLTSDPRGSILAVCTITLAKRFITHRKEKIALEIVSIDGISKINIDGKKIVPIHPPDNVINNIVISGNSTTGDKGGTVYAMVYNNGIVIPTTPTGATNHFPPPAAPGPVSVTIPEATVPGSSGKIYKLAVWVTWNDATGPHTEGPVVLAFNT